MIATTLSGILNKGDRVAVSNITGREASKSASSRSSIATTLWRLALGKDNELIKVRADGTSRVRTVRRPDEGAAGQRTAQQGGGLFAPTPCTATSRK